MAFELACPTHGPASRVAPQALVGLAPFAIRDEAPSDHAAREALLDDAFGPARFLKTCQRLRDGSAPAPGLALAAT
ncbi:MAG: GNAT family N-acetyltransferase, partial [Methylocystis silviterrae]